MNKNSFVIGDIHGAYRALLQLMERAPLQPEDQLIFLGDYVDGWSQSVEVIDYLLEIKDTYDCIFLKGNHDDLLLQWLQTGTSNPHWLAAGGEITVNVYSQLAKDKRKRHLAFLESLQTHFISEDQKRLFMHAGFSKTSGPQNEYYPYVFYWDRSLWETALATDKRMKENHPYYPKRFTFYEEMFIGHTPVTRVGHDKPLKMLNLWNIDTGAAFKGKLSMMNIDTYEVYQSDPVYQLYPEEKGRNR